LPVLLHEFGHALGLTHSSSKHDVMSPYYRADRCSLSMNDRMRAKQLYGRPQTTMGVDGAHMQPPGGDHSTRGGAGILWNSQQWNSQQHGDLAGAAVPPRYVHALRAGDADAVRPNAAYAARTSSAVLLSQPPLAPHLRVGLPPAYRPARAALLPPQQWYSDAAAQTSSRAVLPPLREANAPHATPASTPPRRHLHASPSRPGFDAYEHEASLQLAARTPPMATQLPPPAATPPSACVAVYRMSSRAAHRRTCTHSNRVSSPTAAMRLSPTAATLLCPTTASLLCPMTATPLSSITMVKSGGGA